MFSPSAPRLFTAGLVLAGLSLSARLAPAQDNVLVYGNSIINGPTVGFFEDLVVESGQPMPNVVTWITGNQTTTNYVNQSGLITSSLPSGETWKAMVVCGGTLETTNFMGQPAAFQANMVTLGNALFAHSPNAFFVGHETGADHPNSSRYPSWFPDAAAWLAFPQAAYAQAAIDIAAANPSNPRPRIAKQGTVYANTIGYGLQFYENDLHHLSDQGKALVACLWFLEIYGGRIEDIPVDFTGSSALVTRLLANGITEERWDRIAGYADRSLHRNLRPYPGTDSDFQMRVANNTNVLNLRSVKNVTAGDTLRARLVSPLEANDPFPAAIYMQQLATGQLPNGMSLPGLWLDRTQVTVWFGVADLTAGPVDMIIPGGLAGQTIWLQGVSRGPTGSPTYPLAFSDAQRIEIQ